MTEEDIKTAEHLCDDVFSPIVKMAGVSDPQDLHAALADTLIEHQVEIDATLRGPEAFAFRKKCMKRIRKGALRLSGYEGEVKPEDENTLDLYVTSAYALCANWVLAGCRASRESFLHYLAELDERLLGA